MKIIKKLKKSYQKRGALGIFTKWAETIGKKQKAKNSHLLNQKINWELFHEMSILKVTPTFKDRNIVHDYYTHHYQNILGDAFKRHRDYFNTNSRGFGEDAFHSMWMQIFAEFRPKEILEIGVYRGQTLTLFQLLSNYFNLNANIYGISPMTSAGDEVSNYLKTIDYQSDIESHFDYFKLKRANLIKAFSTDQVAKDLINSKKWDLIYIDGSHDYEVVKSDYELCLKNLNKNGIIVFDDSSLHFDFNRTFKGHPGPSKLTFETVMNEMDHIVGVGHNNVFRLR